MVKACLQLRQQLWRAFGPLRRTSRRLGCRPEIPSRASGDSTLLPVVWRFPDLPPLFVVHLSRVVGPRQLNTRHGAWSTAIADGALIHILGSWDQLAFTSPLIGNPLLRGSSMFQELMRVQLYADEVKRHPNARGQNWMYIGVLAIPTTHRQSALQMLLEDRQIADFPRELKSTELTRHYKIKLATRWLQRVMLDKSKIFHFYILGLNMENLQRCAFGDSSAEQYRHIYSRFFRSAIEYVLKDFFSGAKHVRVSSIFHDRESGLEADELFDWHAIATISRSTDNVEFESDRITFIDSDHAKEQVYPDDSHFIQLIDLILGVVRQCLDSTSREDGITEVAQAFLPLVERLTDERRRRNHNSRYCYVRRCHLAFFPSARLSTGDLQEPWKRVSSSFYFTRRLLLAERVTGQERLAGF